jgi:predicted RNA-binding protein with PIN domain
MAGISFQRFDQEMKRHYIIDGYNLMHAVPEYQSRMRQDLGGVRDHCILRLSGFSMRENAKITVVFDGCRQKAAAGQVRTHVRVVFSKPPEKADPVIKRMADKPSPGEERIVVTSDREIVRFARQCGVASLSSSAFARNLSQPAAAKGSVEMKYERGLSTKEVERWMDIFQGHSGKPGEGAAHAD